MKTLHGALQISKPGIINTDQGTQFTSPKFTGLLESEGIKVSMDGRGRVYDNISIERLWRSVKYEEAYLREYRTVAEVRVSLVPYFRFYNEERFHETLGYLTPHEVYFGLPAAEAVFSMARIEIVVPVSNGGAVFPEFTQNIALGHRKS